MSFFGKKRDVFSVRTVERVDAARYCGTWYEIAAVPRKRQRDCSNTKAEYTLTTDGKISVRNSCVRHGKTLSVKAVATPVSGSGNAWLKVRFFRLFNADYKVIELSDDYSWAAVSNGSGSALWVLSRTPYMSGDVYALIEEKLRLSHIDTAGLVKTAQ